jgi:hypothetical protein
MIGSPILSVAATTTKVLPEGTRVYLKLNQAVSGKRGRAQPGDMVQCEVWRDVELQGVVLVKAGTHGVCKVESVKHANIAGIKGKIVIAAMETKASDGQPLQLTGGYNKEGKSRMALSISLGVIIFVPLIFITGSPAELPDGTVFDAYSGPDLPVVVQVEGEAAIPVISLGNILAPFTAEVILDEFLKPDAKPELFRIRVTRHGTLPAHLVIDNVNGKAIEALPLDIETSKSLDGSIEAVATIKIKTLAKHFQKGINRFEVAFTENGERTSVETILNIQM